MAQKRKRIRPERASTLVNLAFVDALRHWLDLPPLYAPERKAHTPSELASPRPSHGGIADCDGNRRMTKHAKHR